MELFRQWLLGITAAAMLNAAAASLMPKGTVRQIGRLTGGLVMLIAILQPIYKLDYNVLSEAFSEYRGDLGEYTAEPTTENFYLMKSIIEEKCSTYIQDKAQEMDIPCVVKVICGAESTEEYPYPVAVSVIGEINENQMARIQYLIEADLAVPPEAQTYQKESGE